MSQQDQLHEKAIRGQNDDQPREAARGSSVLRLMERTADDAAPLIEAAASSPAVGVIEKDKLDVPEDDSENTNRQRGSSEAALQDNEITEPHEAYPVRYFSYNYVPFVYLLSLGVLTI